jgi:hypothetical protein
MVGDTDGRVETSFKLSFPQMRRVKLSAQGAHTHPSKSPLRLSSGGRTRSTSVRGRLSRERGENFALNIGEKREFSDVFFTWDGNEKQMPNVPTISAAFRG